MAADFKVRNESRDAEADRVRFGKLEQALAEFASDLSREQSGLAARYRRMTDDAGFSLQAFEDRGKADLSRKVDDLAATMKAYRARLAELDRQAGFVTSLQAQLAEELAGHQRR